MPIDYTANYGVGLSTFEQAEIVTGEEPGDSPQTIYLYVDFVADIEDPVTVGQIIFVQASEAIEIKSPLAVSFGTI